LYVTNFKTATFADDAVRSPQFLTKLSAPIIQRLAYLCQRLKTVPDIADFMPESAKSAVIVKREPQYLGKTKSRDNHQITPT
jgi:hypothetical protein